MKNKNLALVDMMGGLGNQLHQISFAKYLEDNGFEVFISTDWFYKNNFKDGTTKRNLEINIKDFNLNIANKKILNRFRRLEIISNLKLIKRIYNSRFNFIYKLHEGNSFKENKTYSYNRFKGYWQDSKYIYNSKEFLLNGLSKNSIYKKKTKNKQPESNTLIHIRKGDYIAWNEDLPDEYFIKALSKLNNVDESITYDIFTDEQNIDKNLDLYKNAKNIFNNLDEKPLSLLSRMQNYKYYIISNSSLSFFAAYLADSKNSLTLFPHPWFKSIEHTPDKNLNWLPINYE
ncbi:MAG: hypothetical protein CMA27_03375 [Euryarchaeota archaeon]|nr:hypothetical protein [Euryarchaeota archaeon]|tara:strand:+ start:2081 stop:2944 length:864 start_codon:yes stop_codon:yes gene_type:complete